MKKIILTFALMFYSVSVFSQVGINTDNPQQLFHTDGKASEQTTNPKTGVPTAIQQEDDVVITKEGQVGIGTISPSEKLEVNGKTKINDLPENGKDGFIGQKTLVADKDGVVGFLNGLPSGIEENNNYSLTKLEGFVPSNAVERNYTYNQLCYSTNITGVCFPNNQLVVNPSYTTTFDLEKDITGEKYILFSIYYNLRQKTINTAVAQRPYYIYYNIEVFLNGKSIKEYNHITNVGRNNATLDFNYISFLFVPEKGDLRPTNNLLEVKISPGQNFVSNNLGTADGYFRGGNANLLDINIKDASFRLYEK